MTTTTKKQVRNTTKKTRRVPIDKANEATPPAPSKTIFDLLDELSNEPPPRVPVDVSEFLKWPDGEPVTLEWRFPSVVNLYKVGDMARAAAFDHKIPMELARDVAMMAACHVSPDTGGVKPSAFYAKIATGDYQRFWFWLVGQLGINFPELKPMPPAPLSSPAPNASNDVPLQIETETKPNTQSEAALASSDRAPAWPSPASVPREAIFNLSGASDAQNPEAE